MVNSMKNVKPNILFIFTDDQRFDTIQALGNEHIITPNLDTLAENGVTFTQAHIPGGTATAVCMPSRAMLHSGRSLFHLEANGQRIPKEHVTLGECLRNAGYDTLGFGKWHNLPDSFNRSFTDGDEILFGGGADHWNVPVFHYDPEGKYGERIPILDKLGPDTFTVSRKIRWRMADHIVAGKHSTDLIADAGISYMEKYQDSSKPFFMYLSFLAPHDPRSMPQKYLDMYDDIDIPLPPNFMGGHPFDNGELKVRDELLAEFPRDPDDILMQLKEYYAMVTHLDDQVGRIICALKESGKYDNTIIIFSGDNGLAVGQHGLMGKQNCYEHSVKVPLILSGPGIERDVKTNAFVYLFDIFPTLCELTETAIPESVDGISFAPILRGENHTSRETLFFAYKDLIRAVKDQKYKLLEYVSNGKHTMTQLFNLDTDPWEMNNLAWTPEGERIVNKLRKRMKEYQTEWDDSDSEWGNLFWQVFDRSPV
jgi:arylsulfatase A-like enzyme